MNSPVRISAPFNVTLEGRYVEYKDASLVARLEDGHLIVSRGESGQVVAIYAPGQWKRVSTENVDRQQASHSPIAANS